MAGDGKRDWVDVIAKLLIPVAIFVIGQQVSCQKDASDREQRRFDRNASLLKSLASKDENEKLITLATINYLIEKNDFPPELLSAVAAVASGDRTSPSTQTAQLTLEKAAKSEGLTTQVQTASMNVPTRVYIQFAAEDQRARAAKLQAALQNAGFIAPGIELRKDNSPDDTDIRYFSNDIRKQADQVKEELLKQHFVVPKDPSNRDNGKVHLNQIEVWIGKNESGSSTPR